MTYEPSSESEDAVSAGGEAMHIHRPKPLHGVREIAVEIGVIVVGVIIALLAEQTVDSLEWAHKVRFATASMTNEISADDGPQLYQRAAMDRCLNAKLDAIEQGLNSHLDRHAMRGLVTSYQLQPLHYDTQQRDAVTSSGVAVHFPEQQFGAWQMIYADIPAIETASTLELRDLGQLHALRAEGGPLSDAETDRMFAAAEALRADESNIFGAAHWTLPHIFRTGMRLEPDSVAKLMGWARQHYKNCLSNVPMDWDGRELEPARPG